jgi:cellulose synthase/poly-beta-1,6-N-acetylglucosamine synthase-like glycosyltransferase
MLARMQENEKIAGVSCPYVPYNSGFLPIMQDIEYVMLDLIQGSYNTFGAIALRGGCFMVKKSAFFQVGKFSSRVMTEDLDLAFKLNKAGYKVQQSFHRVSTFVPANLKTRYKQKIRRNSGGTHCWIKYPEIWIKNPLHVIMIFSFNLLIVSLVFQMVQNYDLFVIIFNQPDIVKAFFIVFNAKRWFNFIFVKSSFSLLSLPYVIPLLNKRQYARKFLLIIPYSIIYVPMYTFVGIIGLFTGIKNYRKLEKI